MNAHGSLPAKCTFYEQNLNLLSSSVTCDESWVTHYDPESKQQSDVWNQKDPPPPS